MAKAKGKCPVCGASIYVNDEKEIGHCTQCGAQINVTESIRLAAQDATISTPPARTAASATPQTSSQRAARRTARTQKAELRAQQTSAVQTIHDMFQICTTEQDYLMLRPKVMQMDVSDAEKARLLEALDDATKKRLSDVLEKAEEYKKDQDSPGMGCMIAMVIGIAVVLLFFLGPIPAVIWAGLGIIGLFYNNKEQNDEKKKAEKKAAADLIAQYRKLGYKI